MLSLSVLDVHSFNSKYTCAPIVRVKITPNSHGFERNDLSVLVNLVFVSGPLGSDH